MSTIVSELTVNTISNLGARGLSDNLMLISVVALLALLILKDVASSTSSRRFAVLSRGLNIAVVPLGLTFAMIAAVRVFAIIG